MNVKEITMGNWQFKVGEKRKVPESVIQLVENDLLKKWQETTLTEAGETWIAKNWGIPSCLVRIDMAPVIGESKKEIFQLLYEVEARPAGLGVYFSLVEEEKIDSHHLESWKEIFEQFPLPIGFKMCPSLAGGSEDLRVFAETLGFPFWGPEEEPPEKYLLWVRAKRDEEEIGVFENRAIAPLRTDGDKTYLVRQGLADILGDIQFPWDEGPWDEGYAIKPLIGARLEGLEIFAPPHLKKTKGSSTRSRILKRLEEAQKDSVSYIIQPFISPQREIIEDKQGWTIWRIFFGYKKETDEWQFLGGWWNWRPNLRVHGASDAVFGLLY